MANIGRFIWLRNRLPSVVGSRFCIGGGVADHQYCLKPFRSHPRSTSPYHAQSTLDEDVEEYKEYKEYRKQLLQYLEPDCPLYDQYIKNYVKATKHMSSPSSFRDYEHVRATPLLDLLSVRVYSSHDTMSHVNEGDYDYEKDQRPCEVYGTIQLIDVENDCPSYVYRRPSNKPETILSGNNLTLMNSKTSCCCSLYIPRAAAYKLRFNLKDAKFDGKAIAKGNFDLQLLKDELGYRDKIMTQVIPGRNGFYASVQYAILLHAVVATVKVTLTKIGETGSEQSESSHAQIYGCISASSKLQQGNVISSVLLDKPPSDPLMVNLGKPIKLSRPLVAVPAYSSLEIKADLWDHHTNQQIATDVTLAKCEAQDKGVKVQLSILGQSYHVRLQIRWNDAYQVLGKGGLPLDKLQTSQGERFVPALSSSESQPSKHELLTSPPIPSFSGSPMVEVFSITAFPDSDANSSICGKICVYDHDIFGGKGDPCCIFERAAWNRVSLSREMKITSLEWPKSRFKGDSFGMRLHLSDGKGREICDGHIYWDKLSTTPIYWCDKLICSVIRGKHGYAAVHYAIFRNAAAAQIIPQVIPNDPEYRFMVIGNISAFYPSITCSSYSEKKFCQSTLQTDDVRSMVSCSYTNLSLQKSFVMVPLDSSLILDFKVKIGVMGRRSGNRWIAKHLDSFDEVLEFKFNDGKLGFKSIERKGYKVEVLVRWMKSQLRD